MSKNAKLDDTLIWNVFIPKSRCTPAVLSELLDKLPANGSVEVFRNGRVVCHDYSSGKKENYPLKNGLFTRPDVERINYGKLAVLPIDEYSYDEKKKHTRKAQNVRARLDEARIFYYSEELKYTDADPIVVEKAYHKYWMFVVDGNMEVYTPIDNKAKIVMIRERKENGSFGDFIWAP